MADAYAVLGGYPLVLIERAVPRALGAFALIFSAYLMPTQQPFDNFFTWAIYLTLWLFAAIALLTSPRLTRVAASGLAVLAVVGVFWPARVMGAEPYCLLAWVSVIVAWTVGRPDERALLLRVCATAVYVFAGLSKLNPTFLSGEHLQWLVDNRPQNEIFRPIVESSLALPMAWSVVAAELMLPALLWWSPTRRIAVMGGVALHCSLIATAMIGGLVGLAFLITLNGLVVLCYAGFSMPERARQRVLRGVPAPA